MLPNEDLKPIRDDIVWLYVYNDFKEGDDDRAATRIRIRFSVSSWPQLLLVDPYTLEVVGETGRTVESFLKAVENTKVEPPKYAKKKELLEKLTQAEELAAKLETKPSVRDAKKALEGEDIVARFRAVEYLAGEKPEVLLEEAHKLLQAENDLLRYEILKGIAAAPEDAEFEDELVALIEQLVKDATGSRNPNVLRSHAVSALARCGDKGSLTILKPFAVDGEVNNMLTKSAVDAVGQIARRDEDAKAEGAKLLLDCFPEPGKDDDPKRNDWVNKLALNIARKAHGHLQELTGEEVEFPGTYDEAARSALIEAFEEPVADLQED